MQTTFNNPSLLVWIQIKNGTVLEGLFLSHHCLRGQCVLKTREKPEKYIICRWSDCFTRWDHINNLETSTVFSLSYASCVCSCRRFEIYGCGLAVCLHSFIMEVNGIWFVVNAALKSQRDCCLFSKYIQ